MRAAEARRGERPAMGFELRTGRGIYRLAVAAAPEINANEIVLTLALERADGVERVVFRCRIERALVGEAAAADADAIAAQLAPWIEREFESTREAALKSIRSERRMHEIIFNRTSRGPF
jgi:hypothetical protein